MRIRRRVRRVVTNANAGTDQSSAKCKENAQKPSPRMMAEKMLGKANNAHILKDEDDAESKQIMGWANEAASEARRKEEERKAQRREPAPHPGT